MTIEVAVPKLSATMEDARLARWCCQVGDTVRQGDILFELETDKAVLEVEATAAGTVTELRAQQGDTVAVGAVIAILAEQGEKPAPAPVKAAPAAPRLEAAGASDIVAAAGNSAMKPLGRPASAAIAAIRATPLARRMAAKRGISLDSLTGTGPRARICRRDIELATAQRVANPVPVAAPAMTASEPPPQPVPDEQAASLSRMRQAIAAQVSESRRTIPSFMLERWIDLGLLEDARELFNRRVDKDHRLTMTDLVLQSIADVLPAHPRMGMVWQAGPPAAIEQVDAGAIGMVVGLDDGVMIPVLKGLGGAGLADISRQRRDALEAVRAGRLGAAFSGRAALSVSNIGRVGVDRFEAIISPGETAILAIGRVYERAVVANGGVKAALGAHFTLSVDHRLIDGLVGGRFLAALADRIERQTWHL